MSQIHILYSPEIAEGDVRQPASADRRIPVIQNHFIYGNAETGEIHVATAKCAVADYSDLVAGWREKNRPVHDIIGTMDSRKLVVLETVTGPVQNPTFGNATREQRGKLMEAYTAYAETKAPTRATRCGAMVQRQLVP